MNKRRVVGISLIVLSAVISLSNLTITGAVVGTSVKNYLSLIGVVIFIVGAGLVLQSRREEGGLVRIIRTERFQKAIKGHDPKVIEKTIAKIGTGLGKEEKLKHRPDYSIRTSKGGRVLFKYDNPQTVRLTDYTPSHKY